MKIFFWQFNDSNDLVRQWALFIINIFILLYTSITLIKTWRFYHRFIFQLLPLSINFIATFIILMIKLFGKAYEFHQIGHLIEIFTYFLFCYTFALMYTKSKSQSASKMKRIQRLWNIILFGLFIILLALILLVLLGIISKNCQSTQKPLEISILLFEAISFIPTLYYGSLILKQLKNQSNHELSQQTQILSIFTKDIYIKERKKQIYLVLSVFITSLFLRLILSIIITLFQQQLFQCSKVDGIIIVTSDKVFGQLLLVLESLNQLSPHIVIPIAMYIVPLKKMSKSIKLTQNLLDEGDESQDESSEQVQQKISSLLSSKLSDGSPSRKTGSSKRNLQ